jgi:bifunctional DNA-binding transcriptional regulator/antitoxin component of YhaV-PrlF toxin-antitoxin module
MRFAHAKVSKSGRFSIPEEFLNAIGLERGGDVVVELDGRELRIRTVDEVVERAQAITQRLLAGKPEGTLDAFLAERRRDANAK